MKLSHKTILLAAAAFLSASQAWADPPNLLTYQGTLKEGGAPVTGIRPVEIQLCSNSDPTQGKCFTTGVQNVPVAGGLFRTTFTAPVSLTKADQVFIQVLVNNTPLSPREQLSSTAFALVASTATSLFVHSPGAITIQDGNQAAGAVLTSDANGVASWGPAGGGAMTNLQVFDSSGSFSFVAPASVIVVEAWGGGGAGSIASATSNSVGGGGGGYAKSILHVTPGSVSCPPEVRRLLTC
ncbi:MAG TPA: hypothetical protein VN915_12400 [Elusimicrobiota bacterium]|nr:hypothetical protein [Elusimicrobiota bacterium]